MTWVVETISEDAPSGENLEYDPAFSALEQAATPGQERQVGNDIVPPDPLDFRDIAKKAEAIMGRSHDIRVGVHMAHAQLVINGFAGFAEATQYVLSCLDQFWDSCHPQLDEEDDNDPTMRINAVRGLADRASVVKAVRQTEMTKSATFGGVSLLDIEIANGESQPSDDNTPMTDSSIAAAFQDTNPEFLTECHQGAMAALANIRAIDAIFDDKTPGQGPDLSLLIKALHRIVTRLAAETGADEEKAEEVSQDQDSGDTPADAPRATAPSGAITSSRDVTAALDRILAYYATHEPSSPLPILIRRAKRLVGADFMTILKDIAPDGVENVKLVGGEDEADEE